MSSYGSLGGVSGPVHAFSRHIPIAGVAERRVGAGMQEGANDVNIAQHDRKVKRGPLDNVGWRILRREQRV